MKRLLLLLACLLALCTGVCAAEPVISEMKTDCTLTGSSSCQVTQSFTLEISGAQTQLCLVAARVQARNASCLFQQLPAPFRTPFLGRSLLRQDQPAASAIDLDDLKQHLLADQGI